MRHPEEPGDEGSRRGLRVVGLWLALGWLGFAALPWNAIGGPGFTAFQWLATWPLDVRTAPAAVQLFKHGRLWFMPLAVALALPLLVFRTRMQDRTASRVLIGSGLLGLVTLMSIAFAIASAVSMLVMQGTPVSIHARRIRAASVSAT